MLEDTEWLLPTICTDCAHVACPHRKPGVLQCPRYKLRKGFKSTKAVKGGDVDASTTDTE